MPSRRNRQLAIATGILVLAAIAWWSADAWFAFDNIHQVTVRGDTCPAGYAVAYVERSTTGAVLFTTCRQSDSAGGLHR